MRTDPAFNKFLAARNELTAYEKSHQNMTLEQRQADPEYASIFSNFKEQDRAAAEAHFDPKNS